MATSLDIALWPPEECRTRIRECAFFKAREDHFPPGREEHYWLLAEDQVLREMTLHCLRTAVTPLLDSRGHGRAVQRMALLESARAGLLASLVCYGPLQEKIAKRSFFQWKEEGHPHGKDYDHWTTAANSVANELLRDAAVLLGSEQSGQSSMRPSLADPNALRLAAGAKGTGQNERGQSRTDNVILELITVFVKGVDGLADHHGPANRPVSRARRRSHHTTHGRQ